MIPSLPPRQRQIAVLKRLGASDKEIAALLGIELNTVKSHSKLMRSAMSELGWDLHLNCFSTKEERWKTLLQKAQEAAQ